MLRRLVVLGAVWLSAVLVGLPSAGAAGGGVVHARLLRLYGHHSSNWSGYVQGTLEKGGRTFHQVSGQWVVPTASQHRAGEAEASSSWTGIGGGCVDAACTLVDPTLIQAGTAEDVSPSGAVSYYAWYELIPAPPITITTVGVHPGDSIQVTIAELVPFAELWSISVANRTTGQSFATTVPYPALHLSAEWVEEAPTGIGTAGASVLPMPNLSTVTFDQARTNNEAAGLVPSEQLYMSNSKGDVATPSAPDPDADGFNDCVYASSCPAPTSS